MGQPVANETERPDWYWQLADELFSNMVRAAIPWLLSSAWWFSFLLVSPGLFAWSWFAGPGRRESIWRLAKLSDRATQLGLTLFIAVVVPLAWWWVLLLPVGAWYVKETRMRWTEWRSA